MEKVALRSVIFGLSCILTGCSSMGMGVVPASQPEQRLVWPHPPLQPRIEWVREIKGSRDFGIRPGFWQQLIGVIAGEKDETFLRPYGILSASGKRLAVVDSGASIVYLADLQAEANVKLPESGEPRFLSPIAITEDDQENLYITDSAIGQLYRYSLRDGSLQRFLSFRLQRPTGIAFNPSNRFLYVAETGAHQIVALDLAGMERIRFGGNGSEPGKLHFPTDIAVDPDGNVAVTDSLNGRIQLFTPEGVAITTIGEPGDTAGHFSRPKGVAFDSEGHIYVCDSSLDMVQVFDRNGSLLLVFGESGGEPGQFWMPSGISIDNDMIYVSDTYNQRIQVFRYLKGEKAPTDPHSPDQ